MKTRELLPSTHSPRVNWLGVLLTRLGFPTNFEFVGYPNQNIIVKLKLVSDCLNN